MQSGEGQGDFSPAKISRAVWGGIMTAPLTLFPTAISGLGWLSYFLLSNSAGLLVGIGSFSLTALYLIVTGVWRFPSLQTRHVKKLRAVLEEKTRRKIEQLGDRLEAYGCARGAEQLVKLQHAFADLEELIDQKFSTTELAYERYHGITEQVYLAALDNLDEVANTLKSIRTIDEAVILVDLEKVSDVASKTALEKRLQVKKQGLKHVETLLSEVEHAMTGLEQTTLKLAQTQTKVGETDWTIEESMEELADLSEFSEKLKNIEKELLIT